MNVGGGGGRLFSAGLAFVLALILVGMSGTSWAGKPGGGTTVKTLQFSPQLPSSVQIDAVWTQFSVRVLKSDGMLDSKNNKTKITISLNSGAGFLSGTRIKTVIGGEATFTDISYDIAETISLKAVASDIADYSKISNAINVFAPPPVSLAFDPQPTSHVLVRSPWAQFAVRALKSDGTLDSGNNSTQVTLSLASGGTGTLSGTLAKTVVGGVASFTDISYDQIGILYLQAVASDIANYSKTSNPITVLAPFAINTHYPANWAMSVPVTSSVSATFNRAVDTSTINSTTFYSTPNVPGSYTVSGSTVTFTPSAPLAYETTYDARVTTGVKDTYGFQLDSEKIWSFTTPTKTLSFNPHPASPVLVNSTWPQFAVRILRGDGTLDSGNNTSQITIALSGFAGVLSGTLTRTVASGIATFNDISYNEVGTISLKATTPSIGNYTQYSNSFTVVAPLAITSVSPLENAVDVKTNTIIRANFNRDIDATTVDSTTFGLTPGVAGSYQVQGKIVSFSPSAYLADNTTYTVTVTTGIKDTSGYPLSNGKVWSFTTWNPPPPAWREPREISQGTGNATVSAASMGYELVAVWVQIINGQYGLFSNQLTNNQWESVKTVVPLSSTSLDISATAVEGDGTKDAFWRHGPYPYTIAFSESTQNYFNGSWTPMQLLGPGDQIAMAGNFGATAVWTYYDSTSGSSSYRASRKSASATYFGPPATISIPTSSPVSSPGVCQNPTTGDAVVVWHEGGSSPNTTIMANRFDASTNQWSTPIPVGAGIIFGYPNGVPLVCDQYGNATVAWEAAPTSGANYVPYAARYDATQGWQTAVQIGPDEGPSSSLGQISLAVDASGAVQAVWGARNGTVATGKLLSNRYIPGSGWGAISDVKTVHAGTTMHHYTALAQNPDVTGGPAAVVWLDLGTWIVYASVTDANGDWGSPEAVSHPYAATAQPQVSVNPAGEVRVIWAAQSGSILSAARP